MVAVVVDWCWLLSGRKAWSGEAEGGRERTGSAKQYYKLLPEPGSSSSWLVSKDHGVYVPEQQGEVKALRLTATIGPELPQAHTPHTSITTRENKQAHWAVGGTTNAAPARTNTETEDCGTTLRERERVGLYVPMILLCYVYSYWFRFFFIW